MSANSEEQAIATLKNTQLKIEPREVAIHYLAEHPTSAGISALIEALQYKEFALRWVASSALAQLGHLALPEILHALVNPKLNTAPLRESVIHILHYGSDLAQEPVYRHQHIEPHIHLQPEPEKPIQVGELMIALKGPAADINSMKVADKLIAMSCFEPVINSLKRIAIGC